MSWAPTDFGERPDCDPKVQVVRALDLFVMGPVMIWAAVTHPKIPTAVRWFLFASGVGTSVFNGTNLVRCLERSKRDGMR